LVAIHTNSDVPKHHAFDIADFKTGAIEDLNDDPENRQRQSWSSVRRAAHVNLTNMSPANKPNLSLIAI
jgi:hypothetical protein